MSLLNSIQMARNTLRADQIGMQVVGQNIANANTPGYIREAIVLNPTQPQEIGGLVLGMGVEVDAIIQRIDLFLEERVRASVSDRASSETQEETYIELEALINELSDTDLSTSLNNFFNTISDILNEPEQDSIYTRQLAVLQGITLSTDINRLAQHVGATRASLNDRVEDVVERINRLTDQISTLNRRIAEIEGGGTSASDAVGLRDQRLVALEELAELIDIRVMEQPSGCVTVYAGGDYLVFEAQHRAVTVARDVDRGLAVAGVRVADTGAALEPSAGELHGLITARDDVLGGFLDGLDEFAGTLAFEFNKIFCSGQGLSGYQELTSEFAVDAGSLALDEAGLPFTPVNGSFQVLVYSATTGLSETTDIFVDLNDLGDDTTLDDLTAALDAVDGISAATTPTGKLTITSGSGEQQFAFANDTSGILAALGLNTFFTGSTAPGLGVNQIVAEDPGKFAASRNGIGVDTEIAAELIACGESVAGVYDGLIADTVQASADAQALAEGARTFEQTLQGRKLSISGVSLDEEAIQLMAHQQSYQASARYIATLAELLNMLISL